MDGGLFVIAITLVAALMAAAAQYLFKRNLRTFRFTVKGIISILERRQTVLGLGMYFVSLLIYLYALHATPILSLVYPVFASSFVFVLLISKYALKERFSTARILGLALIVLGIALVALSYPGL